jgi:hypothetical protein
MLFVYIYVVGVAFVFAQIVSNLLSGPLYTFLLRWYPVVCPAAIAETTRTLNYLFFVSQRMVEGRFGWPEFSVAVLRTVSEFAKNISYRVILLSCHSFV